MLSIKRWLRGWDGGGGVLRQSSASHLQRHKMPPPLSATPPTPTCQGWHSEVVGFCPIPFFLPQNWPQMCCFTWAWFLLLISNDFHVCKISLFSLFISFAHFILSSEWLSSVMFSFMRLKLRLIFSGLVFPISTTLFNKKEREREV